MGKILYFKGDTTPYYKYVGLLITPNENIGVSDNNYLQISYNVYGGESTLKPLYSGAFKLTSTSQAAVAITVPKDYRQLEFTDVNYQNNSTVVPYIAIYEGTNTPIPGTTNLYSIFGVLPNSDSMKLFDNKSDALSITTPNALYRFALTTVQPCYFGLTFDLSDQEGIPTAYRDPNSINLTFKFVPRKS